MSLRIAVVSDLHCHPPRETGNASYLLTVAPRVPANTHPVQSLHELIAKEDLKCDILALPGDFTDRADHAGFVVGVHNVREIAQKLGAETILACLGNHDIDSRKQSSQDPFYLGDQLFPDFPLVDPDEKCRFFQSGYAIVEGENWRCLIVNSVYQHTDLQSAKRGILTEPQLEAIRRTLEQLERKPIQICLSHHHPLRHEEVDLEDHDLMQGGDRLLNILEVAGFGLVIHGHKHHPRLRYSSAGAAHPIPVFSSGSLSAIISDRMSRSVRNTFHIIELNAANERIPAVHGQIWTWEFSAIKGWLPSTAQSAGISSQTGFGARIHPQDLAREVEATFGESKWMEWSLVTDRVDHLKYTTPNDLRSLAEILQAKEILMKPSELQPEYLGRRSGQ